MSVLSLIVEKISNLKDRHQHHEAGDLSLEAEKDPLALLLPELQKYNAHTKDGASYSVYFLTETPDSDIHDLNLTASLAGFYNSRFVFEYLKHTSVKVPIGTYRFFIRKRCSDNPENIFVALVLKWQTPFGHHHATETKLTLDEVNQVAEALSILHARGFQRPAPSSREIVNENHEYIQDLLTRRLRHNFDHFLHVLFSHNHSCFTNSDRAHKILHELYHNFNSFKECADVDDGLQKVLCHNNLCAENVQFNRQDELIGILNWEHASFGHVGLDLTYLMISSMSPSERRQNYLKVLRHYYYSLVDKISVPFHLSDLKHFYRHSMKYAVFFNLFGLIFTLESDKVHSHEKKAAVERWEASLYEAHDVECDKYMSSNEDLRII